MAPHISKTTFVSKDFNLCCKFINIKRQIPNTTTTISLKPDKYGYYTCVVNYHPEPSIYLKAA